MPLPINWSDVGGYPNLAEHLDTDTDGNAVEGRAVLLDAADNLVINRVADRLVAAVGIEGLVVVATDDITLVCPADRADQVKALVAEAATRHGDTWT